jgi:hypothetical protein
MLEAKAPIVTGCRLRPACSVRVRSSLHRALSPIAQQYRRPCRGSVSCGARESIDIHAWKVSGALGHDVVPFGRPASFRCFTLSGTPLARGRSDHTAGGWTDRDGGRFARRAATQSRSVASSAAPSRSADSGSGAWRATDLQTRSRKRRSAAALDEAARALKRGFGVASRAHLARAFRTHGARATARRAPWASRFAAPRAGLGAA